MRLLLTSVCGCIRNSVYEGLYDDVMVKGQWSCRVLERIWSPGKCLQTLSLQFSKSVDGCKLIVSARRLEASSARSQGKLKMAVRIVGGSEVCLSGYSSTTDCTRIMGPAPSERQKDNNSSNARLVMEPV